MITSKTLTWTLGLSLVSGAAFAADSHIETVQTEEKQPNEQDSKLHPSVIQALTAHGVDSKFLISDILDLSKPDAKTAEKKLTTKKGGFKKEPSPPGDNRRYYSLGNATLNLNGERIVFDPDGTIQLVAFFNNGTARGVQDIKMDASGTVLLNVITPLH